MDLCKLGLRLGAVGIVLIAVAIGWFIAQLPWPYSGIVGLAYIGALLFAVGYAITLDCE